MKWLSLWLLSGMPLLVGFYSYPAMAGPQDCSIQIQEDVVACALSHHPDITERQAAETRDRSLPAIAAERPNPELTHKTVGGNADGNRLLSTETSVYHTLELGGKRQARITQATAQGEISSADLLEIKERVVLTTVLSLYRLRQIRTERSVIEESRSTFDRIIDQYRSRPTLPPEQEVSLSVFDLAKEDYTLKQAALDTEAQELESFLEVATGAPIAAILRVLPVPKSKWPSLLSSETVVASAEIRKAEAGLSLAKAERRLAGSRAWPDFKIGPTLETDTQDKNTRVMAGASLSLPLPILNRNRGERQYAALDEARAAIGLQAAEDKTAAERRKQILRYQAAVQSLSDHQLKGDLSGKHRTIERVFEQGLVSSALVIESHRQLYEVTKTLNEQELAAIDALWRIYIIDGQVFEKKL